MWTDSKWSPLNNNNNAAPFHAHSFFTIRSSLIERAFSTYAESTSTHSLASGKYNSFVSSHAMLFLVVISQIYISRWQNRIEILWWTKFASSRVESRSHDRWKKIITASHATAKMTLMKLKIRREKFAVALNFIYSFIIILIISTVCAVSILSGENCARTRSLVSKSKTKQEEKRKKINIVQVCESTHWLYYSHCTYFKSGSVSARRM